MNRLLMRPAPVALALAIAFCTPLVHAQTGSAATSMPIHIAAQPLAQALNDWARQTRIQLAVQQDAVAGKAAPAVSGHLSPRQALDRLLVGSGLIGRFEGNLVTVERVPDGDARSSKETLSEVTVTAAAERGTGTEGTGSYTTHAVTVGKGEQALKDIPQSISVVTRQLMDEQRLSTVYETLASTTGITLAQSPQGGKYIYSRGFDLTTVQFDGVPLNRGMYGRASNFGANMAIYDRAEVLRGAAGLLQGEGNPGGAVNLVRKRPLATPEVSMEMRAGSWDRYGVQLDASGALNAEGTLRGRALVDVDDQHSFIDQVNSHNSTFYGTLEYDVSAATKVSIGASSEEVKGRPFLNGLPRYSTGDDLQLPRSTYFGSTWSRQDSTNRGLYFDLAHAFNDDWKLKLTAVHVAEDHNLKYAGVNRAVNPALMQSANIVARSIADIDASGIDAQLTGQFDAGGRRHELVSGLGYTRTTNDTIYGYRTNYNIFNVGSYNPAIREPSDQEIYASTKEAREGKAQQFGIYNALRLQLSDPLKLIVGARVSWFRTRWDTITTGTSPSTSLTDSRENAKVNPYAGLVYALNPQWSAYVSYADIFKPQTEQNAAGELLQPMVGANYEAGLKGELMDGRVNTSLAFFRIDQNHRAQEDYSSGPTCRSDYYCYTDAGKVRSQGVDAEVSGEVTRRWNVFAGYTFTRTRYLKDVASEGQAFNTYTPKHMLRLWTTYQLPGALSAVTLGGGVSAQSASYRQIGTVQADMPGRAVWNAYAKYQINRHWSATLNLNNVFDKVYYSSITALVNGSYYGDPRHVMLTLRGTF
ncbi:TonB-dependent siderophore receptor [Variovorax ginsengisoli]|uniref:Outer membrane receptor for ferric coprogen and ferric-rhodotorulic acid n=1 Tax=Variovorax ginsengisoli TaxID=363844 RepID=A0ABT9S7P5_9BURK|nr:TonB-dependent receptor [Variovorax ginsengisoli]MDP9899791.1 outer membrane receptor for ferric coprogen and ferric-rhodotorulic acid [Variovorax ginsengisoli]